MNYKQKSLGLEREQRKAYEMSRKAAIKIKSIEVERVHTYIVLKLQGYGLGICLMPLKESASTTTARTKETGLLSYLGFFVSFFYQKKSG